MTVQELSELMTQLRLVFPVVRLVDPSQQTVWITGEDGALCPSECCFAIWGKECRCANCTSMRASERHSTVEKYEIIGSEAFHITSRYLEVDGKDLVLEIVSRFEDRNSMLLLSDEELERRHVFSTLAADFECVNYVNLNAGEEYNSVSAYRISDDFSMAIPGWAEEHSFKKKIALAAQYAVVPEDRDLFLSETELPVLIKRLEKDGTVYVDFRMNILGKINDYQMKFHADRDRNGRLKGFVAGCHMISSETENSLSFKKSALDSVNDVVPVAFWFEDLTPEGDIKSIHFSDAMRSMLGYSTEALPDAAEAFVSLIHPDDRQKMLNAALSARTGRSEKYDAEYRVLKSDGKYMWVNATGKLIKNSKGVTEGMYGAFIDISDHKLKARDMEIINVLTSEYTGVYFIDLKTGEAVPYSMVDSVEAEIGDVFSKSMKYSDVYRMSVDSLVCEEDRAMMLEAGTVGNIMKELRSKKTFNVIYRDANGKYCEMKFIKMGNLPGVPEAAALCFSEKDEELRGKEEAGRKLRRNLDIIGILASEYSSVYYIDMVSDELDTYTMNEETENEFGQVFRAGIKYSSAYKMYVDRFVDPEDKEMMLKAGSVYNILDELADRKSFITSYRNADGRTCEMKFVKVGEDKYPKAVALGFSDRAN